jgi:hypothetical protein
VDRLTELDEKNGRTRAAAPSRKLNLTLSFP